MNETDNQIRLRRAKVSLEDCRTIENEARQAVARAVKSTATAKERYEELFLEEERQEVARRKENQ